MKYMDLEEFVGEGYLQELNRQFLHPLGLALVLTVHDDGTHELSGIWDAREDPEGMNFGLDVMSFEKYETIARLKHERAGPRFDALGYIEQSPLAKPVEG